MDELLSGTKVLDLTRALAGPLCTSLLSDFGADVIKVEPLATGDSSRQWPPFDDDRSLYFTSVNRGKRSVAVDFRSDSGRDLLHRLALDADVLVENFRPGVLADMGLDPRELERENPRLIVMSVSGFGPVGPDHLAAGLDQVAQGMSGLMSVTGDAGSAPMRVGIPIVDTVSGIYAALGIAAALAARERDGRGRRVETSLLESAISTMTFQAQNYISTGRVAEPNGNTHPSITPYGVFDTADFPITIATGTEKHWFSLCSVLGAPELADRADYATGKQRTQHRDQLTKEILELLTVKTAAEWIEQMRAAGIPCGPIHTIDQVFDDPQVRALDMIQETEGPDGRSTSVVRGPFWVDGKVLPVRKAPPMTLGADTVEVLTELGLDAEEIVELRRSAVI
ncbi:MULTISPECIES: CoA transferase [Rhodococcus]|uniref:CoA-transferase n=1 Tax=Rhodococcoides kyotonense TaxID=398843 RepID=A0A177Y879_9NOCA|nr:MULTISPECIES: CoA transferase [Rhodococcus]NIL74848.1 Acetyl-CoA:oxalate CoA-transferase [Rhodococcus sp. B10]OAK51693.1 CoA-transferase [Rhodococcus kyotonensis]